MIYHMRKKHKNKTMRKMLLHSKRGVLGYILFFSSLIISAVYSWRLAKMFLDDGEPIYNTIALSIAPLIIGIIVAAMFLALAQSATLEVKRIADASLELTDDVISVWIRNNRYGDAMEMQRNAGNAVQQSGLDHEVRGDDRFLGFDSHICIPKNEVKTVIEDPKTGALQICTYDGLLYEIYPIFADWEKARKEILQSANRAG